MIPSFPPTPDRRSGVCAPDRPLELRMAVAVGLVVTGYVLVLGLAFASSWALGLVALGAAVGLVAGAAKGAVAIAGGREVSAAEEPRLHETVARLCRLDDRPLPRLIVIETCEANAFAAGWHGPGTICVTRGLLTRLSPAELEGVLAHELAHLANRDAAVMSAAWFLPLVGMAVNALGAALASAVRGRGWLTLIGLLGVAIMVMGMVVTVCAVLVVMGLSRAREHAADRYAAELTGRPRALASALETVAAAPAGANRRLDAVSALLFHGRAGGVRGLFSTHPSTEGRVRRLVALADGLERGGTRVPEEPATALPPSATGPATGIVAEIARTPTGALELTGLELVRRFGSRATARLPRAPYERALGELASHRVRAAEIGTAPLRVRLTLAEPRRSTALVGDVARPRRAPRPLSGAIMGGGLVSGAALGTVLVALVLLGGGGRTGSQAVAASAADGPTPAASQEPASPAPPSRVAEASVRVATLSGTVTDIVDGDTIKVLARGFETTVRLVGIDTPETRHPSKPVQCFGPAASERAGRLLPVGQRVRVLADPTQATRDRYGRFLGYVYKPGRSGARGSVNYALVATGYARGYVYGGVRFQHAGAFLAAERRARGARRGLWGPPCHGDTDRPERPTAPPPAAPSDRTATPPARSDCDPSYAGACIPPAPPDLDCGDVAAIGFSSVGSDPHRFDGDDDGIACES